MNRLKLHELEAELDELRPDWRLEYHNNAMEAASDLIEGFDCDDELLEPLDFHDDVGNWERLRDDTDTLDT